MPGPPPELGPAWADSPHAVELRATLTPAAGDPVRLDVLDGQVVHDAGDTWRTSARLQLAYSEPLWLALREWARPRIDVDVLCRHPGGAEVPVRVARLWARTAGVRRPDDVIDVSASTLASLVSDVPLLAPHSSPAGPSTAAVVAQLLNGSGALSGPLPLDVDHDAPVAAVDAPAGADRWQLVEQLCDAAGLELWQTPEGQLRLAEAARLAGRPDDELAVGHAGNVAESGSDYARESLANGVLAVAEWTDATGARRSRTALAVDGSPTSPTRWDGPAGRRVAVERVDAELQPGALADLAAARLYRRAGAGRGARVTCNLRPWLLPGDTLSVLLPFGGARLQLAQRVEHSLGALTTTIDTRQPAAEPAALP